MNKEEDNTTEGYPVSNRRSSKNPKSHHYKQWASPQTQDPKSAKCYQDYRHIRQIETGETPVIASINIVKGEFKYNESKVWYDFLKRTHLNKELCSLRLGEARRSHNGETS